MARTLIKDVEHAVAIGTDQHRRAMLDRITTLFGDHARHLGEAEMKPFEAIMLHLARSVDSASRAILAGAIADIANAPRSVVRDLAYDPDSIVAGPILARSVRLADEDLVRIVRRAGLEHLDAVSRRRILSEQITEILVTRAAIAAVRRIAGNEGARLSEAGFRFLMQRAQHDNVLRALLDLRATLPTGCRVSFPEPLSFGNGIDRDEQAIVALVAESRIDEALAVVARVAGVPSDRAVQAFQRADLDRLLFLTRSADLGWGTLKHLIQARPGRRLQPEEMRGAFEAFQALPVATARRSVGFVTAPDTNEPIAKVA
ncbi:DUF2336 domain-containing protein [Methylobacterium gossipiicola]|uniref:DUF2336 domain-containing protein n=1 Tax=Methylobacterium gossipiicola TaxID=582675 RepID=A0A1I2QIL9_9HYPH|nr:DUF2336 domain-containing protein [Methylobacterium gossipiicola]SFG27473.1 hypothetical protein SAMN05192565_101124 [Methylobacterium gossipiicola]